MHFLATGLAGCTEYTRSERFVDPALEASYLNLNQTDSLLRGTGAGRRIRGRFGAYICLYQEPLGGRGAAPHAGPYNGTHQD